MKQFLKILEHAAQKYDMIRVFDDFLNAVVCTYSLGRMEKEYQRIIEHYDKETIELFPKLLGELIRIYDDNSDTAGSWTDPVGDLLMEIQGQMGRHNSQFFTPVEICRMIAHFTVPEKISPGQTVNDPSAGSGRTLVAVARMYPANRLNGFYIAQDIDLRVVRMAVINFVMYGMSGIIVHMDTIKYHPWQAFRIFLPETGLGVQPVKDTDAIFEIMDRSETQESKSVTGQYGEQLKLFK